MTRSRMLLIGAAALVAIAALSAYSYQASQHAARIDRPTRWSSSVTATTASG